MTTPKHAPKPLGRRSRSSSIRQSDEIYERLRQEIILARLVPGSSVTESSLTEQYGFSRTPLRRALAKLAESELVRPLPRQGYRISAISLKAVNEVFQARLLIEPAVTRDAARLADAGLIRELRALDARCHRGCAANDPRSASEFLRANSQLHLRICDAAGNKMLTRFTDQILTEAARMFYVVLQIVNPSKGFSHSHAEVIDALERHDVQQAGELSEREVRDTHRFYLNALMSSTHFEELAIPLNMKTISA